MLKGILFDLDGTLVDSLSATFDAFNHGISSQGGRVHSPEEIMSYFGPGEGEIFARIVGPGKAAAAYDACVRYTDAHLAEVPLHAGVDDLLERLKSAAVPISIVTGRSWNTTKLILEHHRLLDRFVTVIANDHVDSPKPSPHGIKKACGHMKLQPADVIYVGDSWVDVRAARSAGALSAAALWDLMAKRETLATHDPHHYADHPGEIWELWRKLSAGSSTPR